MPNFQSKQVKLSDIIAFVQTGFQIRGKAESQSDFNSYNLIQVKDTVRGVLYHIRSKDLDKIFINEQKKKFMNKYLIQKDDVLYLSKLNPGAFRYTGPVENTVAMAHFYILRPKMNIIDSDYLCWALNQGFVKPYVQKGLKGTILPFISKDTLMDLKIPLPGMDIQKKIISVMKLREREKQIQDTIDRKKNILINTILHGFL